MRPIYTPPAQGPGAPAQRDATPAPPPSVVAGHLGEVHNVADAAARPASPGRATPDPGYDFRLLDAWVRAGSFPEQRATAADAIREVLDTGNTTLRLNGLLLTSLPLALPQHILELRLEWNKLTLVGRLPDGLESLYCSHNPNLRVLSLPPRLNLLACGYTALQELDLPDTVRTLWMAGTWPRAVALSNRVQRLDLSDIPLRLLPALPSDLRVLHAANCELHAVPPRWPERLRTLVLRGNFLRSAHVPPTLVRGDLSDNQLTDLPRNVEQLRAGRANVDLTHNPLRRPAVNALLALNRERGPILWMEGRSEWVPDARGDGEGATPRALGRAVAAWYPPSAQAERAAAWAAFQDQPGAEAFSALLDILYRSDWSEHPAFVEDVRGWLDDLATPARADLRATTFEISQEGTQTCHDRALYTYYQMRLKAVEADAEAGRYDRDVDALLELAHGFHAFQALTGRAQDIVKARVDQWGDELGRNEEIEVYLALVDEFPDVLPPFMRIVAMGYEPSARLTDADYAAVGHELQELDADFPRFLSNWGPLSAAMRRWNPPRYEAAETRLRETVDDEKAFEPYLQRHGFLGMAATEALRHDIFAPLVQDYLAAHAITYL